MGPRSNSYEDQRLHYVVKKEFGTVEADEKAMEGGLLLFCMYVIPDQMSRDEFVSLLTCFNCYRYKEHTTKNCPVKIIQCSECVQGGHRWTECKSEVKKCLNCERGQRTLVMAYPIKNEKTKEK